MKLAVVVAAAAVLCAAASDPVGDALKREIAELAVSVPAGTQCPGNRYSKGSSCLMYGEHTSGSMASKTVAMTDLDATLASFGLPASVQSRFKEVLISPSVEFETFHVSVSANVASGRVEEYVGAARNVNGKANLAYMHVVATAALNPQYNRIKEKKCHHCWLVARCCHDEYVLHERGFTVSEIQRISTGLRAFAYQHLHQQVSVQAPSYDISIRPRAQ